MDELIGTNILDFFITCRKNVVETLFLISSLGHALVGPLPLSRESSTRTRVNNGTFFAFDKSQCMDCTPGQI